jgi:hypothetical protein
MSIYIQHEEKLGEKLFAVAVGEAVINQPRQFPFFSGIGGAVNDIYFSSAATTIIPRVASR